jgi:hypothetical protein
MKITFTEQLKEKTYLLGSITKEAIKRRIEQNENLAVFELEKMA